MRETAHEPGEPAMSRVIYISYDGLTDPLGRSQVLPYLAGLAALGHRILILSCEKPARMKSDGGRIARLCREAGLGWHPLAYHKRPPILSSAYDTWLLRRTAARLHRRQPFDIVHCRSYIPAIAGLHLKRHYGVPLLFDMRGFWPDEKIEGNNWNLGNPLFRSVYLFFKRTEAALLEQADHVVSLTHEGKRQLLTRPQFQPSGPPITVIPCCVDFDLFPLVERGQRDQARARLAIAADERVLAYLGSLGSWYMLDEMLDFFRAYRHRYRNARFLFLTHDRPDSIFASASRRGVEPASILVRSADRDEVPQLMAAADLGIFFIQPVFSKKASSPTKMGEMLALGLPIVVNAGVGDVAEIIEDTLGGVAVSRFDEAAYERAIAAAENLADEPAARRERALRWFDVRTGIAAYDGIYASLEPDRRRPAPG
ncbi:MAG: glycosyltransferase [Sphingosinicella sp.]